MKHTHNTILFLQACWGQLLTWPISCYLMQCYCSSGTSRILCLDYLDGMKWTLMVNLLVPPMKAVLQSSWTELGEDGSMWLWPHTIWQERGEWCPKLCVSQEVGNWTPLLINYINIAAFSFLHFPTDIRVKDNRPNVASWLCEDYACLTINLELDSLPVSVQELYNILTLYLWSVSIIANAFPVGVP